jgi:hypothetical protein
MRRPLLALLLLVPALLLVACGSGSTPATGPCGPCQSAGPIGLAGAGGPRPEKLERLALQRVDLARKRLALLRSSYDRGATSISEVFAACRDVAFAARDSGLHGEPLRGVLREYRDAVIALRELTRERMAKGAVGEVDLSRVESLVAEAEFWLEEANGGL